MTEPTRCPECAEWVLRGVAHVCPLGELVRHRRRLERRVTAENQRRARAALTEGNEAA